MTLHRLVGATSLLLLASYAAAVAAAASAVGVPFSAIEPFPIGAGPTQGGAAVGALSLGLGLALGWAIPGASLSLLISPELRGTALLPRSLALGVAYLFLTSLLHASITGGAPGRLALLVLLALPSVLLLRRTPVAAPPGEGRVILVALGGMALLAALLWPKLHREGMNGDGTELYELVRSLDDNPLPRWELEGSGRFGTPITVPALTTSPTLNAGMVILGRGELAIRLPFVVSIVVIGFAALTLAPTARGTGIVYIVAIGAVYVLWNAYYVGWEPPRDLAEPAGTDALTIALFLAAAMELLRGWIPFGVAFLVLASGATWSAPLLGALLLVFLLVNDRQRGARAMRLSVAAGAAVLAALAWHAWSSGLWAEWAEAFRSEYWSDLVDPGRRVPAWPLAGALVLFTGGLPLAAAFTWRSLSLTSRVLALTGLAYTVIVLAGSHKSLHYLMPLPWLFLPAALEATGKRLRLVANAVLAMVLMASWPVAGAINRDTIALGAESCVRDMDYEAAALASWPVHQAIGQPPARAGHFTVGRHTFVRYALELGGRDCVAGLSPATPAGAIALASGPSSVAWTTDPDRFAAWRFHGMDDPHPWILGPRETAAPTPQWQEPMRLRDVAHDLVLQGVARVDGPDVVLEDTVRLILPPGVPPSGSVRLDARAPDARTLGVRINGEAVPGLERFPGDTTPAILRGPWRAGWNVLELGGASGVRLSWIDRQP